MFSSPYDGERATAAALADGIIRKQGLTWPEILLSRSRPISTADKIAFALANIAACSMWERGFLYDMNGRRSFSSKELKILDQIVAKAEAYAAVRP